MNETKKGFIQLHLSVMLAGFTGLFGRLITLSFYLGIALILLSVLLQSMKAWKR